jgi:uncharacterized protein YxeA
MPIPLQPLITLPLYDRPDTYIKLKYIRTNEKNVKAANYIYTYTQYKYSREGKECEAAARK